jgi:TolB-like protein
MPPSGPELKPKRFRVGEWMVDAETCRLVNGETAVHVRPLLVDLLVVLAEHAGEMVSKDEIIEHVWQGRFLSDSVLTRTMSELRHVLGDTFERPRFIETIRKRGYRLIAPVDQPGHSAQPRLAVLPFENLNHNPDYDYFAAGISDALTTELGNIAGLHVISRQSVLALMAGTGSVAEIARALHVDSLVEGSALHAGDRVRITAQLIQAEPERHLWAQSYVAEMGDILELQGRVARAVAEAVEARLTPGEITRLTRPRTVRPEAHIAYLKARYQSLRWEREGLEKGFQYLQQALEIDPDYAPAHALLALAFSVLGYWGFLPVELAYPQAKQAAEAAVHLDPLAGEAHAVLGLMRWLMDLDLDGCEAEMRLAIDLSPSSELAHGFLALFLAVARDARVESLAHTRVLLDLDPLSMNTGFQAAWLHFFAGRIEEAVAQARSTLDMYPACLHAHYVLGWAALGEAHYADAIAAFEQAVALSADVVSLGYLATAYARAGRADDAADLLRELTARRDAGEVPEYLFALVHGGLGNRGEALDVLERIYASRDSRIFWFKVPTIGGPLLTEPGFRALMRRVEQSLRKPDVSSLPSPGGSLP